MFQSHADFLIEANVGRSAKKDNPVCELSETIALFAVEHKERWS